MSGISGCTEVQPQSEIITITDDEAEREARTIGNEVSVTVTDGLNLSLWASEKLLADPIALDVDHNGRAWVTVTSRRSGSDVTVGRGMDWMAESLGFETMDDRRNYLHRVFAPERSYENVNRLPDLNGDGSHDWRDLTVEKESIYRIEDLSGDGFADKSQLFIRDFHEEVTDLAGAVLYHNGEVFLGVGPDLWRLKDTDGDGMADEKESISHGYNVHIGRSGHGMSGLRMGPDGKLYWSVGDHGLNVVDKSGKRWQYLNQGSILRSNPDGSDFEVFAAGVRNTHEFTFDEYGNLITVDHDGDYAGEFERLVHLINGSDSGWRTSWQFGKYSDPKNNGYNVWMDEDRRVRMNSQFELVRRNAVESLMAAIRQTDNQLRRIHGIWGIGQLTRENSELANPLTEYLQDSDPEIRTQTAKILGDIRYEPAAESIIPLLKDEYPRARLYAAEALGSIQSEAAYAVLGRQLNELTDGDLMPGIQLDLIQAVEHTNSEELKSRLAAYWSSKDRKDSVAVYRTSLWGGNAERGRQIFYRHEGAQCTRCHAVGGRGGDVGPELSGVAGRLSREQLLQALVNPGARIAPGFGVVTVKLEEGQNFQGIVTEETDTGLILQTGNGETVTVQKVEIAERLNPPSAMPPVGRVLTRSELRDLVEFLSTLGTD